MRKLVEKIVKINSENVRLKCVRDILAIFLFLWCVNPEQRFYNWWIYGGLLSCWIILSFLSEPQIWLKNICSNCHFWFLFIWPIYCTIASFAGIANFSVYLFTVPFVYLLFWYYFYENRSIKILFFKVISIYYVFINCVSIIELVITPSISRLLANGDKKVTARYASPFTANFQHIYTMTLIIVAILGVLRFFYPVTKQFFQRGKFVENLKKYLLQDDKIPMYLLLVLISGGIAVVLSQYMFAIMFIIAFGGFILIVRPIRVSKKKVFYWGAVVCCILIILGCSLYIFANVFDNIYLKTRMNEVLTFLVTGNFPLGGDVNKRIDLYLQSIRTFLNNPIWGVGIGNYFEKGVVGGHSEFFDCLACYGAVGFFAFISVYIADWRVIFKQISSKAKKILEIVVALFLLQSILNTCYTEQILIGMFFFIPLLLNISEKVKR